MPTCTSPHVSVSLSLALLALALVSVAFAAGACAVGPCERLCEERRASGCVYPTYVTLPCADECAASRELAEERGCDALLTSYHECALGQPDLCASTTESCADELSALQECQSAATARAQDPGVRR